MKTLDNGYLMAYYEDNITLAKTMVIKHSDIALLMNEGILVNYGDSFIDTSNPTTWKYYMNVAGQYHPTDTIMSVMSIDTLQEIDFTVESLRVHTATAKAYQYGTRYYFSLLDRYPSQEFLINGILNPCEIEKAIAARDGAVITYRKDLVETNEHTLISELEDWLVVQIERWYNTQFNMNNDLYAATFFTLLQSKVLNKIINLRLKRCHTYEAHSFHVRMFLASHGELDRYLPYLTLKQSLWLYRNIRYLERHPGMMSQFYKLVSHLLTERGIPLAEYSIKHQDTFTNYMPDTVAKSTPINGIMNQLIDDRQPVSYLFTKEIDDAAGNADYLKYNQEAQENRFTHAASSEIGTKLLHSTMTDLTNAVPETYEEIAIRQWCAMANHGQYPCYIAFKDPSSSITYSLEAKDAFIYMTLISLQSDGLTLDRIPKFLNMRQRKHPKPTVDDLLQLVDHRKRDLSFVATSLIAAQPVIEPCFSVEAFNNLVDLLYRECFRHWFILGETEDLYERGLVENMIHGLYEDELTDFGYGDITVAAWLSSKNLPSYTYTREEAKLLVKSIFEAGSGIQITESRMLKNVQRSLIDLLKELSSYTIQFIREINEDDLILIDWPAVRLGNLQASQTLTRVVDVGTLVLESEGSSASTVFAGTADESRAYMTAKLHSHPLEVENEAVSTHTAAVLLEITAHDLDPMTIVDISYLGQDSNYEAEAGIAGLTIFRDLPEFTKREYLNNFTVV